MEQQKQKQEQEHFKDVDRNEYEESEPGIKKERKKIIVLVDMDGTIADFEREALNRFKNRWPDKKFIEIHDRKEYFYVDMHYDLLGYDGSSMKSLMNEQGFFENLPIIPGAKEALNQMNSLPNVRVVLCTSPLTNYQFCVLEKYKWVEKNLGMNWVNRIVLTKDKTLVHGDYLIDDKPKITGHSMPTWEHIFYEAPYNTHVTNQRRLNWNNWKDVLLQELTR